MILAYKGIDPRINPSAFVAPTAVVIGNVSIGADASIWYGAVVRGDIAPITIGAGSNVQDNCTLHTDQGFPLDIGDGVTIGHNAVVHGCTVHNDCLIGIGAVVLSGACIKTGSVVAAGSVVRERQIVGPHALVAGIPAILKKTLDDADKTIFRQAAQNYLDHAAGHREIRTAFAAEKADI